MVAYQSWSECDNAVFNAVEKGANVIIWFAVNLDANDVGEATISGGPNRTCVEEKIDFLKKSGRDVVHLISVGGWDASHPDTDFTAEEYFDAFQSFSSGLYDGLDWDLEGNDSLTSQWNYLSPACARLMADLSSLLHNDGYIVSMAPPESYFDLQTSSFSLYLNLTYPTDVWPNADPVFSYHGRNSYAAPYALSPTAFDFINLQIYETQVSACESVSILNATSVTSFATLSRSNSPSRRVGIAFLKPPIYLLCDLAFTLCSRTLPTTPLC